MSPFELLYKDIKLEEVLSENLKILKNKLLDTVTSSYAKTKSGRIKSNLSIVEAKALNNLTKQKGIIIQKVDKGNTVVILDKESYIEKIKELLSYTSKFKRLKILPDKHLNFVINSQDKIKNILKSLHDKESLTNMLYTKISPVGYRLGILYGQAKVHKPVINNFPSFRPILGAIKTPSYKLAKFLVPILSPLAINEYTVKDSFAFAKEITKTDCNVMASLNVESLFTNISLEETIENCLHDLLFDKSTTDNLTKEDVHDLLLIVSCSKRIVFYFWQQSLFSNRWSRNGVPFRPNSSKCFFVSL